MGDFSGLILLLLPLAAATGWFVARQSRAREETDVQGLNPEYVRGLSHLVNNDTDQAVEVFIGLIDADEGTIDLHLALGSLFRRRGEVDRALRIHQNLVARPSLKPLHRNQARFELAKDYLGAGVLDRAEEIFLELAHQGMFLPDCLSRLMRLYEREREWDKAIDTAQWLGSAQARDLGPVIAHYYCEKAEAAARRADAKDERTQLKKALHADVYNVRALLRLADLEMKAGRADKALRHLRVVVRQHAEFIPIALAPWRDAVYACKGASAWPAELQKTYATQVHPYLLVELIQQNAEAIGVNQEVQAWVLAELQKQPSWIGMHALLQQQWPNLDGDLQSLLHAMAHALDGPIEASPRYRCQHCGYASRALEWQCPKCHEWNSVQPLTDLSYAALEPLVSNASAVQ